MEVFFDTSSYSSYKSNHQYYCDTQYREFYLQVGSGFDFRKHFPIYFSK